MSFRGNLKTLSLADIFQTLSMNAQSGVLDVVRGKPAAEERHLLFQGGEIRDVARGPHGGPYSFLQYLVGRCLLTEEQAALAERRMGEAKLTALAAIAEGGYAPAEEVTHAARRFAEEDVYELFTWDSGDFEFTDGPAPAGVFTGEAPAAGVKLVTGSVVMEAARRMDEWGRIRQALPSGREVLMKDPVAAEAAAPGLEQIAKRILGLADGSRDIDDLITDSRLARYEVGGILKSFLEAGLLRNAGPEDLERAAQELAHTEGKLPRAVKLYERLIAVGRDTPEVRRALVEAAAKSGDRERAVIHLGVLADREVESGQLDRAAEFWGRMAVLVPASARAHQGLAEYFEAKGKRPESLKHYAALIKAHLGTGAADRALAAARAALEPDPESPPARTLMAETLLKAGRRKEAAEEFERLAAGRAGDGELKAACDAYRRALQIDPAREEARRQLTQLLNAEEHQRKSRKRNTAIAVVAAGLLLVAGGLAANEFLRVKPRYDLAELAAGKKAAEAEQLDKARRFDEAVKAFEDAMAAYEPVEGLWSLTGLAERAAAARTRCLKRISEVNAEKKNLRTSIDRNSADIRGEAEALLKLGRLEEARAKYQGLAEFGNAADQETARQALQAIEASLAEIHAAAGKSGAYRSEAEEFETVLALCRRYPAHPEVRALTFPARVESDPPGAVVRLNGGSPAVTPCTVRMAVYGANELVVERKGYRPERRSPSLEELAVTRKVSVSLSRVPAWSVRLGAPLEAPLTAVDGKLVFGDREGTVWCVSAADGKELWRRKLGPLSSITGGVTVEGGVGYVGSFDGRLYALDLNKEGRDAFPPFKAEGLIRSAPRLADVQLRGGRTHVFFGSDDGRVYCLDARTGALQWQSEKMGGIYGSVLVTNEAVYAASDDEHLHALNIGDGKELWKHKLGGALRTSPLLVGGLICVGADDGHLYAFDPERKEVRWRQSARGAVRAGPLQRAGRLYFATQEGELCAAEASETRSGIVRQWNLGTAITADPLVTETRLYVGSHDGCFRAFDLGSGKELWSYRTNGGAVRAAAVFVEGLVIFGADDGNLYAFDER